MTLSQTPILLKYQKDTEHVVAGVENSIWITDASGMECSSDGVAAKVEDDVEKRGEHSADEWETSTQSERNVRNSRGRQRKQIMTVLLAFLMSVTWFGYIIGLGVLFLPFRDSFGSSRAETSLVMSISFGTLLCGSAFTSPVLIKFGPGPVGFLGGLLATVGLVISFLAPTLPVLILSGGFITGCGLCVFFTLIYSVVGAAIENQKWRDFALAFVSSGTGFGGTLFPLLNEFLVEQFGWRGAMLLLGGVTLQFCPMALFVGILSRDLAQQRNTNVTSAVTLHKDVLNLSLFTDLGFLTASFSVFVLMALVPIVNLFLPDIAKEKGFDIHTGAFFLTLAGLTSLIGRAFYLIFSATTNVPKIMFMGITFLLTGISVNALPFADTYGLMAVAVTLYSVPWGAMFSAIPGVIFEIAGKHRYTSAMGYIGLLSGIASFVSGPFGGAIKDKTGSYNGVVYLAMSGCCASAVCMFILHKIRHPATKTACTVVESNNESTDL